MRVVAASASLSEAVRATIVSEMAGKLGANVSAMRDGQSARDFLSGCGFGHSSVSALSEMAVAIAVLRLTGPGCRRAN